MKKLRIPALLLAAALFLLPGCNIIKVNPDRDGAQVVATVDGVNITKKDVYNSLGYDLTYKPDAWDVDSFNQYKAQMLESLIAQKVELAEAKKEGLYNFTADEQKTIDDYVSKNSSGLNDEQKTKLKQSEEDQVAYDKLKKTITDKVTVADSDVQTEYNTDVTNQKTEFDADASKVITEEMSNNMVIVYYPNDAFVRVRQILIPIDSDTRSKITTARNGNDNTTADKLLNDAITKIQDKANDALTKAQAASGDLAKLDQLIKDTGDNDPGMDTYKDGYLVTKGTTQYVQPFTDTALALTEIGKPSGLVKTDYGYEILWLTKKEAKGAVPYADVKDKLTDSVKSTKQDSAWETAVEGWVTDYASKIHRYTGRLNN